ncbi:MAG: hypothetical protein A2Y57_04210 [Candidatus Woykebacteria bacterium RBG_13_40_7b]|uniref:RNA polymerase sigma factor 70 region 4 type 2 domain-containing protein n=1 Tax=Candidatus Woykebacteria bacterium RBG_13_40_7b TaxID=1802594 RepID=A0A1G1W9A2_9BACT|nr:MAG: hypothetical protein A2Y57_04210 [Candidatus Woykebacteria bacterium RBG_13_40_7b]
MPRPFLIDRIPVVHVSIENLAESGFEIPGKNEEEINLGNLNKEYLERCLTRRQREVASFLFDGYTRKETAKNLTPPVSLQAVHQIVLRMRRRLTTKGDIHYYG